MKPTPRQIANEAPVTTYKGRYARVEISRDDGKTWAPVFLDEERLDASLAAVDQSVVSLTSALSGATITLEDFSRIISKVSRANGSSHQRRKARRAYVRWLSGAVERSYR